VEVDGQIITIYDPVLHRKTEHPKGHDQDARWVLCHRPHVLVGGELTIEMLDLQLNPSTGFYTGPLQMKANNGILIVDDFGRQRVSPRNCSTGGLFPWSAGSILSPWRVAGRSKYRSTFSLSSPRTWTRPS